MESIGLSSDSTKTITRVISALNSDFSLTEQYLNGTAELFLREIIPQILEKRFPSYCGQFVPYAKDKMLNPYYRGDGLEI